MSINPRDAYGEYIRTRLEHPRMRRGLVFALRANGSTYREIADIIGVSVSRARELDRLAERMIPRLADKWFAPPPDWKERAQLVWCYRDMPYYAQWALRDLP